MHLPSLAAACALACCATALAQDRKPLVGRVVDGGGAPVAGAEVTLVWSPPGGPECGAPDRVSATTDARGRFVAKVLPQESYSAWALATAADGTARTCTVHEGAAAGGDLEMRLDLLAIRRKIELIGTERWAHASPLRLEVAPRAANMAPVALAADGRSPPLPPLGFAIVRDAAGQVLFVQRLPRTDAPASVALPPVRSVRLRVTDDQGAPIAGAAILHPAAPTAVHVADTEAFFARPGWLPWRVAGRTAADGTATVVAPGPGSDDACSAWPLIVRQPGMAESVITQTATQPRMLIVVGTPSSCATDAELTVKMQRAGRLALTSDDVPPRAAEVLLTAGYVVTGLQRVVRLAFAADGTCELPIPLAPVETMLHVRERPGEPWHLLRFSFASGQTVRTDLAWQRRLSLQFLDETGGPARGLTGVLVAIGSPHAGGQQVVVSTDQAGRLERLVGWDAWLLFVTDGVRCARFDVPNGGETKVREFRATVTCERFETARFRVRDAVGAPLAGAGVVASSTTHVHPLLGKPAADPATGLYAAILHRLGPQLVQRPASDANGLLEVPLPPGVARRAQLGAPGLGTVTVELAPGDAGEVTVPATGNGR